MLITWRLQDDIGKGGGMLSPSPRKYKTSLYPLSLILSMSVSVGVHVCVYVCLLPNMRVRNRETGAHRKTNK